MGLVRFPVLAWVRRDTSRARGTGGLCFLRPGAARVDYRRSPAVKLPDQALHARKGGGLGLMRPGCFQGNGAGGKGVPAGIAIPECLGVKAGA